MENLTVLRFSNLVFEPLWSRKYIRNVQVKYLFIYINASTHMYFLIKPHIAVPNEMNSQVILSEELVAQTGRYQKIIILLF